MQNLFENRRDGIEMPAAQGPNRAYAAGRRQIRRQGVLLRAADQGAECEVTGRFPGGALHGLAV